jgi:hypothetical protein
MDRLLTTGLGREEAHNALEAALAKAPKTPLPSVEALKRANLKIHRKIPQTALGESVAFRHILEDIVPGFNGKFMFNKLCTWILSQRWEGLNSMSNRSRSHLDAHSTSSLPSFHKAIRCQSLINRENRIRNISQLLWICYGRCSSRCRSCRQCRFCIRPKHYGTQTEGSQHLFHSR